MKFYKKTQSSKKSDKQNTVIQKLSLFFYEHTVLSLVFWLSLVVFGSLSYTVFMQRQGFPSIEVPISVVRAQYFAGDKEQVDSEVTKPVVDAIETLDGVSATNAATTDVGSTIVVEFEESVTSQAGADAINNAIDTLELPENAQVQAEAVSASKFNNEYDVLLSVYSDQNDYQTLETQAEVVVSKIEDEFDYVEAEVIEQFNQGVSPVTGEQVNQRTLFDYYGAQQDGKLVTQPSVGIGMSFPESTDIISFDNELKDVLSKARSSEELSGSDVAISADFANEIRRQTSSLQENLGMGLLLVVLVCMLFIGIKAGLVAALGMGVTLSTTVGILFVSGLTLNVITLFALILCLGLIVDDTIIITESIDNESKTEKDTANVVSSAVKRIALASLAGTLTTMLGFAPMLFIGGILGEFIVVMPITILISLAVSFIVSITFIPFTSRWFAHHNKSKMKHSPLKAFRNFESSAARLLARPIESANTTAKKVVQALIGIAISVAFILGSGYFFSQLKFNIFPSTKDADAVLVQLNYQPNTSITEAQIKAERVDSVISEEIGEYVQELTFLGSADARSATARLTLISYHDRELTAKKLIEKIEPRINEIRGVRATINQLDAGPPADEFPFKVQIAANDSRQATEAGQRLAVFLDGLEVERPNGSVAQIDGVDFTGEQQVITRKDGVRIVQVSAKFDADDVSALVSSAKEEVEMFIESEDNRAGLDKTDYFFDFGNESDNQESFNSMLVALPLLLLSMYILLALQFKSVLQPLLIMFATPFSFFGVALGLYLTDNPLSFFTMIGFFALIGISVNNTILLTDYANQEQRAGVAPRQAMANALKLRFRPLLTTTTTSVLALLPLALTEPFWESIAYTLIFGLISSSILVIIAFPYYYLIMERLRRFVKHSWRKIRRKK